MEVEGRMGIKVGESRVTPQAVKEEFVPAEKEPAEKCDCEMKPAITATNRYVDTVSIQVM